MNRDSNMNRDRESHLDLLLYSFTLFSAYVIHHLLVFYHFNIFLPPVYKSVQKEWLNELICSLVDRLDKVTCTLG